MKAIGLIALKEVRDGIRNRWLFAITLVFALLAFGLAYFGSATAGQIGFTSLASTLASLSSLTVFLVPLIGLLLAYDAIVGEDEQGTLLLLLTYPLSRTQLLLGKFVGHGLTLALATGLGFTIAAVAIVLFADGLGAMDVLLPFARFALAAVLLGWVFIAFAYLISVWVREKSQAAGLALALWFLFVLIFDLVLLALLVGTEGRWGSDQLAYLLLLNPTDVFRMVVLMGLGEGQGLPGVLSLGSELPLGRTALTVWLMAWVCVPVALALWRFRSREV